MDQVQVRIITTAITHQYGTLETGTVLRTSPEFAKHLVEEARAAEYIDEAEPVVLKQEESAPDPVAEQEKPAKRKKSAEQDAAPVEPGPVSAESAGAETAETQPQ